MKKWGEAMSIRRRLLILVLLAFILNIALVYADNNDSGWKGYGLYNLSKSGVTITNESDMVKISGSNVEAVYEYTIRNDSDKEIVASLGIPDNGTSKFSVHDGSKYLKYWKTSDDYVKKNYGVEKLPDHKSGWHIFNMVFSKGQSRTIRISISAEIVAADNDTYAISIFKDRSYPYTILSEKINYRLIFEDFRPYNIVAIEGFQPDVITDEGDINLSYVGNYGGGGQIIYQPIDKMAAERLGTSAYKKPKAILKDFIAKNYQRTIDQCNEYIEAPADKNLSVEQIKYIKAESYRLSGMKNEYLQTLDEIDTAKLYPGRIRYKLLIDKLELYDSAGNKDGINSILKEMIPEIKVSYPYMLHWLDSNGYKLEEDKEDPLLSTHTENTEELKNKGSVNIPEVLLKIAGIIRDSWISYLVIGFILGFIVGRISKRKKRRRSVYMFRD